MTNTDWNEWRLIDSDLVTVLGIFPASESHLYLALNEPGAGELKIPLLSEAAGVVASGQFAQCSYRGAVRGGFFIENISKGQADASEGAGQWVSISGRGALSLLDDAMVWDDGTSASTRNFTDMTRAEILITLIDEAQARDALVNLSYDFSATLDSDGQAWTDSETLKLTVGTSLLDVVRQFARTGIDFDIQPDAGAFVLSAYKLGKGTDKSESVYLRTGENCEEVTSDEHGDKIKNALRVAYKDGYITVADGASITARRRREKLLDLKMAQTSSSATTIGAAEVELSKDPKKSISVKIYDGIGARAFIDYDLGDYIMLDVQGVETRYRIYGIQPDWTAQQFSKVIVELNSILYENDIQMAKDIDWLMDQWNTANDANLLEVSFWAAVGGQDSDITAIHDIVIMGNIIWIAGEFKKIGGIFSSGIISYDITNGKFTGYGFALRTAWSVFGIGYCLYIDGADLYLGGLFDDLNGDTMWGLAKYSGGVWSEVGGGVSWEPIDGDFYGGKPYSILKQDDWLYITGAFQYVGVHIGSVDSPFGAARYDLIGEVWEDLGGVIAKRFGALLKHGGDIYAIYTTFSPTTYYVAHFDGGTTWTPIGDPFDDEIYCLASYGDDILVGGKFTGGIAKWDGATWETFGGGTTGEVRDITIFLTDVYIVGLFSDLGNNISKYSGGAWFTLTTGLNAQTNAIALFDTDVYVGGLFTTAGDKPVKQLAVYFNNFESLVDYLDNDSSFDMGAAIHNAPASAISDADEMGFWEDVTNALRKITWANIKATLKIYFDTLFVHLSGDETIAGVKSFSNKINIGAITPPSAGGDGSVNQAAEGLSAGNTAWTFGSGFASFLTGIFARGTKASPSAALTNDIMLKLRGRAHDDATYGNTSVEIRFVADQDHTLSAHGTRIEMWVTPNGSTTLTKAITIENDGHVNIDGGNASTY